MALVVIATPLVSVLFERGRFGPADTTATALAVAVYGLGLPAFVLQKVLQPLFFAREDTKRPFYYAVTSMVVNAALAIGLAGVLGYISAAVATSVAAWAMVIQLWIGSRAMGDAACFDDRLRRRAPRIVLASIVMGVVLWGAFVLLGPMLGTTGWRYLGLLLLILSGTAAYAAAGVTLGAFQMADFKAGLKRKPKP